MHQMSEEEREILRKKDQKRKAQPKEKEAAKKRMAQPKEKEAAKVLQL